MDPRRRQWNDAIAQLVREASDEQLAGMVGPDRRYYAEEAVRAAEEELAAREERGAAPARSPLNTAALALGPFWYFYNGMVGRGAIISALVVAAAVGLQPVARTLGVPATAWIGVVVVAAWLYCGFFGERDLAESRADPARLPSRPSREPLEAEKQKVKLAAVAQVGCRAAAEQTRLLLRRSGIDAVITRSKGSADSDEEQTRVLVREEDALRARTVVEAFLASGAADCRE